MIILSILYRRLFSIPRQMEGSCVDVDEQVHLKNITRNLMHATIPAPVLNLKCGKLNRLPSWGEATNGFTIANQNWMLMDNVLISIASNVFYSMWIIARCWIRKCANANTYCCILPMQFYYIFLISWVFTIWRRLFRTVSFYGYKYMFLKCYVLTFTLKKCLLSQNN